MSETQLVPQRPRDVPLHRWPWAYVVLANLLATLGLLAADLLGAFS